MGNKRKQGADLYGIRMIVGSGLQECPQPECPIQTGKGSLNIYLACPYHFEDFCPSQQQTSSEEEDIEWDEDD